MNALVDKMDLTTLQRPRLLVVVASLGALLAIYWPTLMSMVDIWDRSETFTHGYFIFPIAMYLVWGNRQQLSNQAAVTDWRALIVLLGLGMLWYVAQSVSVMVVEQLAFVLMIPVLVWLLCGFNILKSIAFPMAFLVFAVPMGEVLITPMMNMTAFFVIEAVRLTGIPIYSDGLFFSLPSGNWSVVEGCSGVRYLIASVTLGTLYSYLNYNSYRKRALFILASFIVPVIANWLRAFIIVMLGHFSNMKIATGVDHLIYGWFFFGIVIFLLFWVGSFWRDDAESSIVNKARSALGEESFRRYLAISTLALCGLLVWPWLQYQQSQAVSKVAILPVSLAAESGWVQEAKPFTDWQPRYLNPTQVISSSYSGKSGESGEQGQVGISLQYYAAQKQDSELINTQNVLIEQKHETWRQLSQQPRLLEGGGVVTTVLETHLNSYSQDLLVWHWQELGGVAVNNAYYGKLLQAYQKLVGNNAEGMAYIFFTPINDDREQAVERLKQFIAVNAPLFRNALNSAFNNVGVKNAQAGVSPD